MFASKITATAGALNVPVKMVRDPAQLGTEGDRLILDLNQSGTIEAAAIWKAATGGLAIGFVSHVDQATIEQARAAGIDQILPRSQFVAKLADLLNP